MRRLPAGMGILSVGLLALMIACGSGKKANDPSDTPKPDDDEPTEEEINEMMAETGLQFDQEAAEIVLKRGARKVSDCHKEGAPIAEGTITAVFDGPKGRIVDVELGYEFEDGNEQGQRCIKNAFIGEIIPPFEGEKKVEWPIKIEEGGAKKDKKDDKKKK